MTAVWTVATAGALLVSEMLAPLVDAAAVRLTVPCPLPPTARLVMLRATPDTLAVVGAVGEAPHRVTRPAAIKMVANLANRVVRRLILISEGPDSTSRAVRDTVHGIPRSGDPAVP
jgi:hypothetical protein